MGYAVLHTVPVDDVKEHSLHTEIEGRPFGEEVCCYCDCHPRRIQEDDEKVIFVHRSYDGREALEEANEVLGLPTPKGGWIICDYAGNIY